MIRVEVDGGDIRIAPGWGDEYGLPQDSILIARTPFTWNMEWTGFLDMCRKIQQQWTTAQYVFIDASWDPVRPTNTEIVDYKQAIADIFPQSKVALLSARAQHFYDNIPGVIYFPLFGMFNYPPILHLPRRGRFGCLNRRPSLQRLRLMYELLDQGLFDPNKDVYSVSFVHHYSKTLYNFEKSGYEWMTQKLQSWPDHIATHPDGFPNDYSVSHPAWHTGIVIINETETGEQTIVCEKTAKGILSKSCFSIFMADVGYRVLEDLGFEPRFFADHAEYDNIDPLLDLVRKIPTEKDALDYRQQHIAQINHNFEWFGADQSQCQNRPWWNKYAPKLKTALANL